MCAQNLTYSSSPWQQLSHFKRFLTFNYLSCDKSLITAKAFTYAHSQGCWPFKAISSQHRGLSTKKRLSIKLWWPFKPRQQLREKKKVDKESYFEGRWTALSLSKLLICLEKKGRYVIHSHSNPHTIWRRANTSRRPFNRRSRKYVLFIIWQLFKVGES